jgi:hypothetical protein
MSAISCHGHAAGETVFCKDFSSGFRGLAPITGQGVSGGCSDHFLHGSASGIAGGGSDHLAHSSITEADPYSVLEDEMWGERLVLSQRSYPLATQPYVPSEHTVSTGVARLDFSSPGTVCFASVSWGLGLVPLFWTVGRWPDDGESGCNHSH